MSQSKQDYPITKIFDSIIEMNENKKGGRIRLIEIDQLLKNKFDIHYTIFKNKRYKYGKIISF